MNTYEIVDETLNSKFSASEEPKPEKKNRWRFGSLLQPHRGSNHTATAGAFPQRRELLRDLFEIAKKRIISARINSIL